MKKSENIVKRGQLPVSTRKKSTSVSNGRSTKLLDRAGYISDFGSGLYALTALGQRYSSEMNFDFDTKNSEKERVHTASYGI